MNRKDPRFIAPRPSTGPSTGEEWQVFVAVPIPVEEWESWKRHHPKGVKVRNPKPKELPTDDVSEPEPANDTLPTEEEIATLPRWARVAFAARCARRALPHFRKHWPDSPVKYVEAVERAVSSAETTNTAHAVVEAALEAAHSVVADAANKANFSAIKPASGAVAVALASVAACNAAIRPDKDVSEAANAVKSALSSFHHPDTEAYRIRSDFNTLRSRSHAENWTDDTPVPPTVFGPLWPEGTPPGWPEDDQPNRELTFEIDIPDEATDADVKRYVELLVRKADDLYRAGGGNGLKISGLDVTGDAVPKTDPTPTEAPTAAGGAG